jgi:hypothetical protein
MNPDFIEDEEILYRAISDNPSHWKPTLKKPTSALFKDKNGVSVDRDGQRSIQEIEDTFENRKPGNGLCCIPAGECRELQTYPIPKPLDDNAFHAEIHYSATKIFSPSSVARKLSSSARIIKPPKSYR